MNQAVRKALLRLRLRQKFLITRPAQEFTVFSGKPRVYVALAADYGNLGDLAITRAQIDFVSHVYPAAEVIEIPISQTLAQAKRLKKDIRPDDLITLIGGGNSGDLYDDIQWFRELFVRQFPANPILSFPQTVEFSDTVYGRWSQRRASRIYRKHPRLHIVCRDAKSLEMMATRFPACSVSIGPDVVLTACPPQSDVDRAGTLVVLRDDLEKSRAALSREQVTQAVAHLGAVTSRDTHVGDVRLDRVDADEMLTDVWNAFSMAGIVVTDRLHGMIFAVITGTPCLALDSRTGKVGQFYRDWLSEVPSVRLVGPASQAELTDMASEMSLVHVSDSQRLVRAEQFLQLLNTALPADADFFPHPADTSETA